MNRLVIFSHGFGVKQDNRGLFTDIALGLSLPDVVMFDYGTVDEANDTISFPPLIEQAAMLEKVVREHENPDTDPILICHSQGCLIAAIAKLPNVKRVIMLAPPMKMGGQRTASKFRDRPGTVINPHGESRFARADGSVTIVSQDYLGGLDELDPVKLIGTLADKTSVTVIKAEQDEVLSRFEMASGELGPKVKRLSIPADHNFTGAARPKLVELLRQELS